MLPKKEFTSFDVAAVVRELKEAILDSRVSNIYQLDRKTVILKLHKIDKPPLNLILESGRRLHLTSYALEKPEIPPAFCMALRKYLRNACVTDVGQYEFERVVMFSFKGKHGVLQLVLELFREGNIILIGEEGKILQALIYKRMRDRNVLRGEVFGFAPPAGKNPKKISEEEFLEALKSFGDMEVVRAITRLLSIGGFYAEEILLRVGIEKTQQCSVLSEDDAKTAFDTLQDLLLQVATGLLEPLVVQDATDSFIDVVPVKLKRYEGANLSLQSYNSFNEALDEFYVRIVATEKATHDIEADKLKREAERLKRIIAEQERALIEAKSKAELNKQIGDLIYAYSGDFQTVLDKFLKGIQSGKEWKAIISEITTEKDTGLKLSVLFESFNSKGSIVNVSLQEKRFGLDLRKTVYGNAAIFYERGKLAKQKLTGTETALNESRKKLDEIETKIRETEALEHAAPAKAFEELAKLKVKPKEWFEKYRWFISSDGFLIVAGKDATSNEVLIKKYAENNDIVFHADVAGAPFVVVKTEKKKPSAQCLHEAGEFAAAFSRGWREGFASVDVYWVKPQQLSKVGSSGEYVSRGAFVVTDQRNWLRNVPLKVSIGVVAEEKGEPPRFIGGPVEAVKTKAKAYVTIVPGTISGKEIFKQIISTIAGKIPKELREKVLKSSIEEIREYVPYGKGKISEN